MVMALNEGQGRLSAHSPSELPTAAWLPLASASTPLNSSCAFNYCFRNGSRKLEPGVAGREGAAE